MFLRGEKLTDTQAIAAKCCDCDDRLVVDDECLRPLCPLSRNTLYRKRARKTVKGEEYINVSEAKRQIEDIQATSTPRQSTEGGDPVL